MKLTEINYRQYSTVFLLLVSVVALFLLGTSYLIEIRVIIEQPNYGDVTGIVRTFWRATLGATTIGSFLIGVYTLIRDEDDSDGPTTKVEIKGTGHDIDVYPSRTDSSESDEDEEIMDETASKDDAPDDSAEGDSESNTETEKSVN